METKVGTKFKVPDRNLITNDWSSSLRKESFQYRGPKLFNAIPIDLRNSLDSIECFKAKLDDYISMIPDNPRLGNTGISHIKNDLDCQITRWNWILRNGPF